MNSARIFSGSPYNVSPLCSGCPLMLFADKMGFDMHQCDKCKEAFENLTDLKELEEEIAPQKKTDRSRLNCQVTKEDA